MAFVAGGQVHNRPNPMNIATNNAKIAEEQSTNLVRTRSRGVNPGS